MNINKLSTLLKSKFGLEARDINQPSPKQLRILARLPQNRMGDWLLGMRHVSRHIARHHPHGWTVDFSKAYFMLNDKIVYAWRIIIQGPESIDVYEQDILNAFNGSPRSARGEVMEVPLMGASASRNGRSATGKGASTIEGSDNFMPTRLQR